MSTLNALAKADQDTAKYQPFGAYQEEAIVSLALDHPEFFGSVGHYIQPNMFARPECQYLMAKILNSATEHSVIPTRNILRDDVLHELTEDDNYESVLTILNKISSPREVPLIKDSLVKWARNRAFGLLYSDDAVEHYRKGDFSKLEEIVQEANRIQDFGDKGFWFFENLEMLFKPESIEHRTTGFPKLDRYLNNGGPSPKEVLCWLAATNVGKSQLLCNNAITSLKGFGPNAPGQDVLLVTFELDAIKTAMRCLGTATNIPLLQMSDKQDIARKLALQIQNTYEKQLLIYELAPDECSVNHIYALMDSLKRMHNWKPGVIILDYLDLMVSRNPHYNKDDYGRQKHVANEVRGLAKNENVLIFTATQTNRSGTDNEKDDLVGLNNVAESFGKQFSMDYIVSLNQSKADRESNPPQLTMHIAKNRNGPKHETIRCTINYNTMSVRENS
jgi:replicative DNA helicase